VPEVLEGVKGMMRESGDMGGALGRNKLGGPIDRMNLTGGTAQNEKFVLVSPGGRAPSGVGKNTKGKHTEKRQEGKRDFWPECTENFFSHLWGEGREGVSTKHPSVKSERAD